MASNELVQNLLISLPGSKLVADNRQILLRCPICGDSVNISSAHMYIGPLKDESKPLQFDCKKCSSTGLLDGTSLRTMGVYDYTTIALVNEYNKNVLSSYTGGSVFNTSKSVYNLRNAFITDDAISQVKLKYINDRLGLSLTYEDCISNKIVLNLKDILIQNNIEKLTRHPDIVEQLNKYFIGFLSYDNCFVNMRRLCPEGKVYSTIDKRYVNYNIFNKLDNSMRFYLPPVSLDIADPSPIHVYITEGPFDIASVKFNVSKQISPEPRSIFISVGGKSYLTAIKFVLGHLGIINAVIHLCPDGDVDDYAMYNISDYISVFNLPTDMLRNTAKNEKDFGVSLPHIDLSITRL